MKYGLIAAASIAALAASGVAGMAITRADAQSAAKPAVILIVDRAAVIGQSKAGKTIAPQAEKIKANVQKELQAEVEKLKKDVENYQKNAQLMSEEVRKKTEAELGARQQYVLPQQEQIMQQAFAATIQKAETKVLTDSAPIMKEIVDRRGATFLLDRSAVMYAAPETDITAEVVAALDKKVTTVTVDPVSLAEITKKLKELQAQQGQKQASPKKN